MEAPPLPCSTLVPPPVLGAAALAERVYAGAVLADLVDAIGAHRTAPHAARYDLSLAFQLAFRRTEGLALQARVLGEGTMFRIPGPGADALRVLALLAPGDLMVNTPIEFIAHHLNLRLDLLYVVPDRPLPPRVPEHDVAFFAASESDAASLGRLAPLFRVWPRPALNDPARIPGLARYRLARRLAGIPGLCHPPTIRLSRARLLRPVGAHGGAGLVKADDRAALAAALARDAADEFHLCPFVDYRGADGRFRKYRIALIGGEPLLCHVAISDHWMVHYLNAGMAENAAKRAEEAALMATFATGFARRHARALAALAAAIGLDYVVVDCAETGDGRLLVFEADVGAIVHLLDPPEVFPYKHEQMRKVFAAFEAMLRRASGGSAAVSSADPGRSAPPY